MLTPCVCTSLYQSRALSAPSFTNCVTPFVHGARMASNVPMGEPVSAVHQYTLVWVQIETPLPGSRKLDGLHSSVLLHDTRRDPGIVETIVYDGIIVLRVLCERSSERGRRLRHLLFVAQVLVVERHRVAPVLVEDERCAWSSKELGDDWRNHASRSVGHGLPAPSQFDVLHGGLDLLRVGRVGERTRDAPDFEDAEEGEIQLRHALQY